MSMYLASGERKESINNCKKHPHPAHLLWMCYPKPAAPLFPPENMTIFVVHTLGYQVCWTLTGVLCHKWTGLDDRSIHYGVWTWVAWWPIKGEGIKEDTTKGKRIASVAWILGTLQGVEVTLYSPDCGGSDLGPPGISREPRTA